MVQELGRQRWVNLCKLNAILIYKVSFSTTRGMLVNLVSNKNKYKIKGKGKEAKKKKEEEEEEKKEEEEEDDNGDGMLEM